MRPAAAWLQPTDSFELALCMALRYPLLCRLPPLMSLYKVAVSRYTEREEGEVGRVFKGGHGGLAPP